MSASRESTQKACEWLVQYQARLMHEPQSWCIAMLAEFRDTAIAEERKRCAWTKASDAYPPRGCIYLVKSESFPNGYKVSTVCYGMHDPLWCDDFAAMRGASDSVTPMRLDDEWTLISAIRCDA